MKRVAFSAVLAAFVAVSVTVPSAAHSAANGAMDAASQPQAKKRVAVVRHRAKSTADARACLQFTTNVEITRCAEKYL
jgi:hypothetical protein